MTKSLFINQNDYPQQGDLVQIVEGGWIHEKDGPGVKCGFMIPVQQGAVMVCQGRMVESEPEFDNTDRPTIWIHSHGGFKYVFPSSWAPVNCARLDKQRFSISSKRGKV